MWIQYIPVGILQLVVDKLMVWHNALVSIGFAGMLCPNPAKSAMLSGFTQ